MENLAQKIKKIRKEADLSMADLSKRTGLSEAYLSKLEKGEYKSLSLRTCKTLADGLSLSLREFLEKVGFLELSKSRPSFQMISQAFRSQGYSVDEAERVMDYAKFIKQKRQGK